MLLCKIFHKQNIKLMSTFKEKAVFVCRTTERIMTTEFDFLDRVSIDPYVTFLSLNPDTKQRFY